MTTLDNLFRQPAEPFELPRLRDWRRRLREPGSSATVEIDRPDSTSTGAQPEISVQFSEPNQLLPLETMGWDEALNIGLIRLGVRAITPENEAIRVSLGLNDALREPARRYGDGYFNAVLVDLIKDSDLIRYPEVAEVIQHAPVGPPDREGRRGSYETCREMIADAIGGRARELTGNLKYPLDEAKAIMTSALAQFLDAQFSVSYRKRLGWL